MARYFNIHWTIRGVTRVKAENPEEAQAKFERIGKGDMAENDGALEDVQTPVEHFEE